MYFIFFCLHLIICLRNESISITACCGSLHPSSPSSLTPSVSLPSLPLPAALLQSFFHNSSISAACPFSYASPIFFSSHAASAPCIKYVHLVSGAVCNAFPGRANFSTYQLMIGTDDGRAWCTATRWPSQLLSGSLSFRSAWCTNYTPTQSAANSWQELKLSESQQGKDSYSHCYSEPNFQTAAISWLFWVPLEDNVGMCRSLARPVSLSHSSLMPPPSVY